MLTSRSGYGAHSPRDALRKAESTQLDMLYYDPSDDEQAVGDLHDGQIMDENSGTSGETRGDRH